MTRILHWRHLLACLFAMALLAAGCGASADDAEQLTTAADEPTAAPAPPAAAATAPDTTQSDQDQSDQAPEGSAPTAETAPEEPATEEPASEEPAAEEPASEEPVPTAAQGTGDEQSSEEAAINSDEATEPAQALESQAVTSGSDGTGRPAAPNGRTAPDVATDPEGLAAQIASAEAGLLDPQSTTQERADWGHLHQVAIRKLGYEPEWDIRFFEALPREYHPRTLLHVAARRALVNLTSGYDAADFIPAWEIVEPESAASLLSHYQEAEAATGIEWEFLAGINLVETGMGRIRGLSSAGAQGPMQFLPTTWNEAGIGAGDINDPRDAINGAARYLVRRGGPIDMPAALWGYNNSDDYVTAVRSYAELLRQDPSAYEAIFNWEIYFFTEAGDVWLPTGLRVESTTDLTEYLLANPWSTPDPNLRIRQSE